MSSWSICQSLTLFCWIVIVKSIRTLATVEKCTYKVHNELEDKCKEHKIIPDVITQAPEHKIEIAYNEDDYVNFGTYLTIDQIKEKPTLLRWHSMPNLLYTLMLISPDCPTRENPKEKEWQYWLVTNIQGGDLKLSRTLTEYSPPTEIRGKEPHRMIFLAFLQRTTRAINFTEPLIKREIRRIPPEQFNPGLFQPMGRMFPMSLRVVAKERAHFDTRKFAEKYGFPGLTAMNFFLMRPTNST